MKGKKQGAFAPFELCGPSQFGEFSDCQPELFDGVEFSGSRRQKGIEGFETAASSHECVDSVNLRKVHNLIVQHVAAGLSGVGSVVPVNAVLPSPFTAVRSDDLFVDCSAIEAGGFQGENGELRLIADAFDGLFDGLGLSQSIPSTGFTSTHDSVFRKGLVVITSTRVQP